MSRKGETGAALLDVLIALAITAMIAAALTQSTRFGLTIVERSQAASKASTETLLDRRLLQDMLRRIEAASPGRPTTFGEGAVFFWRGPSAVEADDAGDIWRLTFENGVLSLAACDGFDDRAVCTAVETYAVTGPMAFAGPDGVFGPDWPEGPPPHLIRIGDLIVAPRIHGAVR